MLVDLRSGTRCNLFFPLSSFLKGSNCCELPSVQDGGERKSFFFFPFRNFESWASRKG